MNCSEPGEEGEGGHSGQRARAKAWQGKRGPGMVEELK